MHIEEGLVLGFKTIGKYYKSGPKSINKFWFIFIYAFFFKNINLFHYFFLVMTYIVRYGLVFCFLEKLEKILIYDVFV